MAKLLDCKTNLIDEYQYKNNQALTSVIVPDGTYELGYGLSENRDDIEEVIIPDNVKIIDKHLFKDCKNLKRVVLPKHIEEIPDECFMNCPNLVEVVAHGVKKIGERAFYNCESLEKFNFPDTLETVQKEAFTNCNSLKEITIGPHLKTIEPLAFSFMGSLERINVDSSNETFITFDNKLLINSLWQSAVLYANGSKDKEYSLKDYNYVVNCLGHEVIRPVAVIGEYAFAGAKNLEKLTLCSCTKDIEKNAFIGCDNLKNLRIEVIPFYSVPGIDIRSKGQYYSPEIDKEKAYLPFESVEFVGEASSINPRALLHFTNVKRIALPDADSYEIGTLAFFDCDKLESVSIPSSVSSMQDNAFNSNTELKFKNGLTLTGLVKLIDDDKLIGPYKLYVLEDGTYYIEHNGKITVLSKKYIESICSNSEIVVDDPIVFLEFMKFLSQSELFVKELFNGVVMKHMSNTSRQILTSNLKSDDDFFLRVIRDGNLFNAEDNCSLLLLQYDGFQNVVDYVNVMKKYNITNSALYNKFFMAKYPVYKFEELINYDCNLLLKIARDGDLFEDEEVSLLYEDKVNKHNSHYLTIQILEKDLLSKFMPFVKKHNVTDPYLFGKSFIINHENKLVDELFKIYDANTKRLLKNSLVTSNSFTTKENLINLLILMKITGALEADPIIRQRASTFITEKMFLEYLPNGEKNKFRIVGDDIHRIFDFPCVNHIFNEEFAEFFFNNFYDLITEERKASGFIQRVYFNFDKIKKTALSNKGSQRQLKVTMDKCRTYLYAYKDFPGVTDDTRKLAEKVGYWFGTEGAWRNAEKLYYESLTAPRNIFTSFEDENGNLVFDNDSSNDLREDINDNYSYEWLPKQTIDNIFLGKHCNCCAHLLGAGRGITRASMIHPDCQNLVIRNQDGEIISKATIFVNREDGYGVFNTVETNFNYRSDEDIKKIYNAFIRGVEIFVDTYNKNNEKKPITRITVGTKRNTLAKYLNCNKHPDTEILESLYYSEYSDNTSGYSGDWMHGQKLILKR